MIRKQIEAISFNLIQLHARRIELQWFHCHATKVLFQDDGPPLGWRRGSDQFPQDYGKFARGLGVRKLRTSWNPPVAQDLPQFNSIKPWGSNYLAAQKGRPGRTLLARAASLFQSFPLAGIILARGQSPFLLAAFGKDNNIPWNNWATALGGFMIFPFLGPFSISGMVLWGKSFVKSPILAASVETFNGLDYVLSQRKVIKLWWEFKRGMKAILEGFVGVACHWRWFLRGERVNLAGGRMRHFGHQFLQRISECCMSVGWHKLWLIFATA